MHTTSWDDDLHLVPEKLSEIFREHGRSRHDDQEGLVQLLQSFQNLLFVAEWNVAHDHVVLIQDTVLVVEEVHAAPLNDGAPQLRQRVPASSVSAKSLPNYHIAGRKKLSHRDPMLRRSVVLVVGGHLGVDVEHLRASHDILVRVHSQRFLQTPAAGGPNARGVHGPNRSAAKRQILISQNYEPHGGPIRATIRNPLRSHSG